MHQIYHRIGRLPELIFDLFLFGIGCVSTIYG